MLTWLYESLGFFVFGYRVEYGKVAFCGVLLQGE